jgi:alkanesulfonate monooxygenase SsuD/methylene tetrahydromethanopterin reductase-like flavin-dependent oxidoreductase (luciferase family)
MEIGIGLPNAVAGTTGEQLVEFAERADEAGFSSLGTLDRIAYQNFEPIASLGAAAAVTERIRLTTAILIAPLRANGALLAKQAATVHRISGGRMVLGVAAGGREDDSAVSGLDFGARGRVFDRMLADIRRAWAQSAGDYDVGPDVSADPPPLIIGGAVQRTFERAAEYGDGWIMGGGTPDAFAEGRERMEKAWSAAGREGEPRRMSIAYFALGPNADAAAGHDLEHYYSWLGDELASAIAGSAATDEDTVRQYVAGFQEAGCDELILFPTSSDPEQVELLAEVALEHAPA